MKQRMALINFVLLFVGGFSLGYSQEVHNLDDGLKNLSSQIVTEMTGGNKQKIAVIEFSDLDGKITELGKFISEELITRLFISKKFDVVERQLLNKILQEHKLNLSGLVDETTAKKIGSVLGVDAICSGTITDLVNSIKINARLISTETGSIFAVASVQMNKDEIIKKLMRTSFQHDDSNVSSSQTFQSGELFYKEDFSGVKEGMMPTGWIGGDKLMVRSDGRRKYLTDFERQRNHKITVSDIKFPENFEFKYTVQFGGDYSGTHVILYIGSIKTTIDVAGWCLMNESKSEDRDRTDFKNKVVQAILRKDGPIFRFFVDGVERIVSRYPNFKVPMSFSLEFESMTNFKLIEIVGKRL